MPGFHPLRVAEVTPLCEDAVAITLDVPGELAERYAFLPGQSLTVRYGTERRSYSICAPAGARPRIGVRAVPGGLVSEWLVRQVRPGDQIDVAPPTGRFTPGGSYCGHHVLLAAGSGITPLLSIAASVLDGDPEARVTILLGNRRSDTIMFAEELADLKDAYVSRVALVHVLSREPRLAEACSGRLDATRLRVLLPALVDVPEVDHWWLCGPYPMVTEALQVLAELGARPDRLHRELFYVEDVPPDPVLHIEGPWPTPTREVTVKLDGRSTTVSIPRDATVLDGAQRARPDLPFACKGGVCGTCRARLQSGEVRMRRNFALDPAEVAAGFVLTCQAQPLSESVAVDYDA